MAKFLKVARRPNLALATEDLVLLLDESGSMSTTDLAPSRIVAAKRAALGLLGVKKGNHPNDRVGVVGFSTNARVHQELTSVKSGFEDLESAINTVDINGGTVMARGLKEAGRVLDGVKVSRLGKALERFFLDDAAMPGSSTAGKRVIMLSDGANLGGGNPETAADALKERGIVIDTIGIGGTPKDVDEKMLKAIASANPDGSKRYVFIKDTEQLIRKFEKLGRHLRKMEVC